MFGIPRRAATFDVVFDDARLNEDLEHASAAGRSVGHAARSSYRPHPSPLDCGAPIGSPTTRA